MGGLQRSDLIILAGRPGMGKTSLGISLAKVLPIQAEQMRITRRQKAEETAREASIKMLFPLVFLVFPAMFAVLLGPAVPQLMETMGGL